MYFRHKKSLSIILLLSIAFILMAIVFANLFSPASATMNISVSPEKSEVKIHTGSLDVSSPQAYSNARTSLLEQLAVEQPEGEFTAVVPLNNYYTVEEVNSFISSNANLTIERIYMWIPGETGKLVLDSTSNNIQDDIDRYINTMSTRPAVERSSALKEDLQELENGKFMVYALTVTGSAENLNMLSTNSEMVSFVDLKYNPEAEAYAAENDMSFSYLELPEKPDGAL